MRIEVVSIHDTADGGCRVLFEMDDDTMYQFMRIGLMSVLRTAAEQATAEHDKEDDE
jgi:hypothetical protein